MLYLPLEKLSSLTSTLATVWVLFKIGIKKRASRLVITSFAPVILVQVLLNVKNPINNYDLYALRRLRANDISVNNEENVNVFCISEDDIFGAPARFRWAIFKPNPLSQSQRKSPKISLKSDRAAAVGPSLSLFLLVASFHRDCRRP